MWRNPGSCFAVLAAGGAPRDSFALALVENLRKGLHDVPQIRVSGCEWPWG